MVAFLALMGVTRAVEEPLAKEAVAVLAAIPAGLCGKGEAWRPASQAKVLLAAGAAAGEAAALGAKPAAVATLGMAGGDPGLPWGARGSNGAPLEPREGGGWPKVKSPMFSRATRKHSATSLSMLQLLQRQLGLLGM